MKQLYISTLKNLLIATLLTAALFGVMLALKVDLVFDKILFFSILATISGVCYILTIRNPQNYVGFYFGIASSVCLGVQFALLNNFDLTFLYFLVFIPFQISAIRSWQKKSVQHAENEVFMPKFLTLKNQIIFLLIFIAIIIIDYVFASFYLSSYKNEPFFNNFAIKTVFAIMISSSILANFLMIGKWLDTWIFWIIYSAAAIISAIIIKNNFNLLLFTFFLIINTISFVSWLKIKHTNKLSES
ncbi:MAG: nicotinamide mononucleotide transporter [Paludibacter sp.]|nr:nicotinamide mononucleotide transporter [Paludibacter sp.]